MRAIATAAEKLAAGAEYHCDCLSITMSSNQRAADPEVWSSLDIRSGGAGEFQLRRQIIFAPVKVMSNNTNLDMIEDRFLAAYERKTKAHAAVGAAIEARNAADRAVDIAHDNAADANDAFSVARAIFDIARCDAIRATNRAT